MKKLTLLCLFFVFLGHSLSAGNIIDEDSIAVTIDDCHEKAGICLEIPASIFSNFQIFQNGQAYAGNIAGCDFDTMVLYSYNTLFGKGSLGPYFLDLWTANDVNFSGQFNTIDDLVDLMNVWDPAGNWVHDANALTISGGSSGSTYTDMLVTALLNNTPSIIGLNFGLDAQGMELSFEVGEHELILIDNVNLNSDTVTIIVDCIPTPTTTTFFDTIRADVMPYVYCLDTIELPGMVTGFFNICPLESGTHVNFWLDIDNLCVKYQGKKCNGKETACIVICDDLDFCDTTFVTILVDNTACDTDPETICDEILINFSEIVCLDTTEMPGNIASVEIGCGGGGVDLDIDENTMCVTYTGVNPGADTSCVILFDQFGNADTTFFCIDVLLPQTEVIDELMPCGTTLTTCLETVELAGAIESIENVCDNLSGEAVDFDINDISLCIDANSLNQGTDTACIVICDQFAVCDTTLLIIDVFDDCDPCEGQTSPEAADDQSTTFLNTPVNISILDNDFIPPCAQPTVSILDIADGGLGPNNGMIVLNVNATVDYIPNAGFCGEVDVFTYLLCNPLGCDTADVIVDVECEVVPKDSILIYDGISPNDDGKNDIFTIKNIENFPENELRIYNRWGSRVYEEKGYNNTWDGTWDGKDLPDGTYFYFLKLNDREKFKGYLQIKR